MKVRRAYVKGRIHPPKSKYGKRDVPITLALADALRAARARSEWCDDDSPVFPHRKGGLLLESNLRRSYLTPVMQEIGVSWSAGFHSFRHTAASMMIARGDSPVQVQRRLRHHSPGFTLSTYVHLFPGEGSLALDVDLELDQVGNAEGQHDCPY